jgi:hypothetical protein
MMIEDYEKQQNLKREIDIKIAKYLLEFEVLGKIWVSNFDGEDNVEDIIPNWLNNDDLDYVYLGNCQCEHYDNIDEEDKDFYRKIFGHYKFCLEKVPNFCDSLELCYILENKLIELNLYKKYLNYLKKYTINYDLTHVDSYSKCLAICNVIDDSLINK